MVAGLSCKFCLLLAGPHKQDRTTRSPGFGGGGLCPLRTTNGLPLFAVPLFFSSSFFFNFAQFNSEQPVGLTWPSCLNRSQKASELSGMFIWSHTHTLFTECSPFRPPLSSPLFHMLLYFKKPRVHKHPRFGYRSNHSTPFKMPFLGPF